MRLFGFYISREEKFVSNIGAWGFMPPESFQGEKSFKDKPADIWALGMAFLNMYTNDIFLNESCHKILYTPACYKNLMNRVASAFSQKFGLKQREITMFGEAEKFMEVIQMILNFDSKSRPSAIEIVKKLENLIGNLELI